MRKRIFEIIETAKDGDKISKKKNKKEEFEMPNAIKEIRASCGMTQAEFAEALKIPKHSITNWEQEVSTPPEYLVNLIKYYVDNEIKKQEH